MTAANRVSRVAVVARAPLLREGIAAMLRTGSAAEVVKSVATVDEIGPVSGDLDVLVVHLNDPRHEVSAGGPWPRGVRIVGVHDGLPGPAVRAFLATGVATLVDTSSAPKVLVDAVRGTQERTLLRWTRPGIGPMPLSPREHSVLELLAAGLTSRDVAEALEISPRTVEKHKQRIFDRLGVQNQAQAVAIAVRAGLLNVAEPGAAVGTRGLV